MVLVWPRGCENQTEGFSSAALLSQSISRPTRLPENHPNYTHWVHGHTCTNFALSPPPLSSLPSLSVPDSNGSISERSHRLWSIFSVILSFQIKGRFVFKLSKSSDGPRQRANIPKCLSRSICVMAEMSVSVCVCRFVHWPFSVVSPYATLLQQSLQTTFLW